MSDSQKIAGEAAIIQGFLEPLSRSWPGAFGLLDDCAVVAPAPGHELVVKTDPVRQGVHFFADDAPADIAWKAVAVNVSDLAAKAARPVAYMLALSLPDAPTRTWMAEFAEGLRAAQEAFGCVLIGGDTDQMDGPLSAAVTVFGEVPSGRMVRRATPAVGDALLVSGTLGDAALGLRLRQGEAIDGLRDEDRAAALARYLRPRPRLGLRVALRTWAHAAMDVSDGLGKDLGRMCHAGGLAAEVELARLPLSAALIAGTSDDMALRKRLVSSGDDYEVLCAVAPSDVDQFVAVCAAAGETVTNIGRFIAANGAAPTPILLDESGNTTPWGQAGYDHFS